MIVVDSSVWVDYFRGRATPEVEKLDHVLGRESLIVGDVILCEVLLGVSSEREARTVETALRRFDLVSMLGIEQAPRTAALYRMLRGKGITIRKTIDLIIGAWCISHGVKLLHSDRDFRHLEQHAGLMIA